MGQMAPPRRQDDFGAIVDDLRRAQAEVVNPAGDGAVHAAAGKEEGNTRSQGIAYRVNDGLLQLFLIVEEGAINIGDDHAAMTAVGKGAALGGRK